MTDVKLGGIWNQIYPDLDEERQALSKGRLGCGAEGCREYNAPARVCFISTHPSQYFSTGTWHGTLGLVHSLPFSCVPSLSKCTVIPLLQHLDFLSINK